MKSQKLAGLAATAMIVTSATALADEIEQVIEHEVKMQVIVSGDGSSNGTTINWSSTDPNLDLHNMQVGESQAIIDDAGRSVLVTKEEGGLRFDVDGESVVIPDMGEMHGATMAFVSADGIEGVDHDIDVQVIGDAHAMASSVTEGVMIITSEPLDSSTQQSIRSVLQSAGHDDEVTFVDGSGGANGPVKVMRKTVEIRN